MNRNEKREELCKRAKSLTSQIQVLTMERDWIRKNIKALEE